MLPAERPESYYGKPELVPTDLLEDVNKAKIVITNFHAFKLRERMELSAGGRAAAARARGRRTDTSKPKAR